MSRPKAKPSALALVRATIRFTVARAHERFTCACGAVRATGQAAYHLTDIGALACSIPCADAMREASA